MTAVTPPLVDVIAGVLAAHLAETMAADGDGFWIKCHCGAIGEVESDAEDWGPANTWLTAHQASAVLAALETAGGVEVQFGLNFGDEVSQQDTLEDVHDERDAILGWIGNDDVQRSDYGPLEPVTRTVLTHVGPWTAVAG